MTLRNLFILLVIVLSPLIIHAEEKSAVLNFQINEFDNDLSRSLNYYLSGILQKKKYPGLISYNEVQRRLSLKNLEFITGYNDELLQMLKNVLEVNRFILGSLSKREGKVILGLTIKDVAQNITLFTIEKEVADINDVYPALDMLAGILTGSETKSDANKQRLINSRAMANKKHMPGDMTVGVSLIPIYYPIQVHSGFLMSQVDDYKDIDNPKNIDQYAGRGLFPVQYAGLGTLGIDLHMAFTFARYKKASIGFTYSAGYAMHLNFTPIYMLHNVVTTKFAFRLKMGKFTRSTHFLCDMGLLVQFDFPHYMLGNILYTGYYEYGSAIVTQKLHFYPDFFWGFGPYFFMGFEYNKKNFSYEMGLYFAATFGSIAYFHTYQTSAAHYNVEIVPIALVLRWNYYHYRLK